MSRRSSPEPETGAPLGRAGPGANRSRPSPAWIAARRTWAVALALATALAAAACARRADSPRTHRVLIHGFAFDPAQVAVAAGDTVEWVNQDIVPHTATATNRAWDTGSIGPDSSARVVIEPGGIGPYACSFHPQMKAALVRR